MIFVLSKFQRFKILSIKCSISLFQGAHCRYIPNKEEKEATSELCRDEAELCIVNVSSAPRLRMKSTSTTTTPPSGATTPTRTRRPGTVTPVSQWRPARTGSTSPSTGGTTPRRTRRRGRGPCPRRSPPTSTATWWPRCPPSVSRNGVQPYIAIHTEHSDSANALNYCSFVAIVTLYQGIGIIMMKIHEIEHFT